MVCNVEMALVTIIKTTLRRVIAVQCWPSSERTVICMDNKCYYQHDKFGGFVVFQYTHIW